MIDLHLIDVVVVRLAVADWWSDLGGWRWGGAGADGGGRRGLTTGSRGVDGGSGRWTSVSVGALYVQRMKLCCGIVWTKRLGREEVVLVVSR